MEKSILGIVPGLQATALVGYNLKNARSMFSPGQSSKKQLKTMIRGGVGTMVGVSLMKPTASMINSM
jgi:hypothetical protein